MRSLALLLLPLAISAPTQPIEELSVSQWTWVQSALSGGIDRLSSWTWRQASEVVETFEEDKSDHTIWQQLKADPHSFSKLVKIIEFEGGEAIKYLDGKKQITFFAPNNDALTPPKHNHHGHHDHHDHDGDHHDHHHHDHEDIAELIANPSLASISSLLDTDPSFTSFDEDKPDDDEKKRRREMIRKLVGKVLQYHGLPEALTAVDVAKNSTLATALEASDGSYGGLQRRIKVKKTLVPPAIKLNFYAQILATDRKASNGYFHTLSAPLIPPPSIFESTYLFPDIYSTFTSAAQGLGESEWIKWEYQHGHKDLDSALSAYALDILHELGLKDETKFKGTPLATVFVPTNSAFALLPPRLKFYLFSPFGQEALRKILAYHYVYDSLILTEFQYFGKGYPLPEKPERERALSRNPDTDGFSHTFDVISAFNQTLHIQVEKKKVLPIDGAYKNTIRVNGIETLENDVPARNGAFHPIGLILVPPHHHHGDDGRDIASMDSWTNWEEWLPQWAAME